MLICQAFSEGFKARLQCKDEFLTSIDAMPLNHQRNTDTLADRNYNISTSVIHTLIRNTQLLVLDRGPGTGLDMF